MEDFRYCIKGIGCNVKVMWHRNDSERFTSGTEIRRRIAAKEEWKDPVPPFVYKYITENEIDKRLI